MIKPTIGRVVWYKDSSASDQMMPALICYVWDDAMVNLMVSDRNGITMPKTSVPLFQGHADECPEYNCCWMPYQQNQAAQAATKEAEVPA